MKKITAEWGMVHKDGMYTPFNNGTVLIFDNECEVFQFDTEQQRSDYIVDNDIEVEMEDFDFET